MMGHMRTMEVVESFPLRKFCVKVLSSGVRKELIELLLVGSVCPFDFSIETRCRRFDVHMVHAEVLNMPMELSLELMTIVRSDGMHAKREL